MADGGQRHAPAALPPGKTRYLLYRRLGGHQGRYGRVRKISPPPGFDPRTVKRVASRYTDWDIPAHSVGGIEVEGGWSRTSTRVVCLPWHAGFDHFDLSNWTSLLVYTVVLCCQVIRILLTLILLCSVGMTVFSLYDCNHAQNTWLNPLCSQFPSWRVCMRSRLFGDVTRPVVMSFFSKNVNWHLHPCTSFCYYDRQNKEHLASIKHLLLWLHPPVNRVANC
jgi:hypothetical protein